MKKTIKDSLRHLPGIVATLYLFAAAACMPESFRPGIETPGSQDRSPMTLELGISSPESSVRTRADESGPMQDSTINSIWIGVFDIETGDLVGQTASNRAQGKTEEYPFRTAKVDILYYDAHPQVRIFGVANYIGVNARRTGDSSCNTPLDTLLSKVENITDFLDISVEAKKPGNSAPLMMGVYTKDVSGLYAVDVNDNSGLHKFNPITDIELNKLNPDNPEDGKYGRIEYADIRTNGQIRLRRLVSQINVTVVPGQSLNKTVELSNMSYRRVNLPKEVYLQERQTKEFESSWNATEWSKQTPNKADVLVDYDTGNSALGYESDTDFKAFNNSFTFYQYENKHWGTAANQSEREKVWKGTDPAENPVFTALCGEEENGKIYNNYASYFEINVDVAVTEKGSTRNANVTYRIHEGFCNKPDGTQYDNRPKPDEPGYDDYARQIAPDFTCVRNTIYKYTITINGLSSIIVDAEGEHEHTNPGVLGGAEFFTESTEEATKPIIIDPNDPENGDTYSFTNVEAAAYICYYANGGSPKYYEGGDDAGIAKLKDLPILPAGFNAATKVDSDNFGFKFDGESISDIFSPATRADGMGTKTINGTISSYFEPDLGNVYPEDYKMSLYLLLASEDLGDGCVNNTYTYIDALPFDERDEMGEFDFSLAFANDWDENPDKNNGAVVGHLKKIQVTDLEWKSAAGPDDLKYTVFLDDKLIADEITTWPFDLEEFNSYTANSVHTIKVVAEDPDNEYKPCTISQNFIVYPTEFEWSYQGYTGEVTKESCNYGAYNHDAERDGDNYYALTHMKNMTITNTYMITGEGDRNIQEVLSFDALFDGIVTITAASNNSSFDITRTLLAGNDEASLKQIITGTTDITPYTFAVKRGKVHIYTTNSLRIYSVKFTYPSKTYSGNWNFSDDNWKGLFATVDGLNMANGYSQDFYTSIDGLSLEVKATKKFSANSNNKNFSFVNTGADLQFNFYAVHPGTLQIDLQPNGTGRTLYIAIDNIEQNSISLDNKRDKCSISIQKEGKVSIYVGGGTTYIYSISYTDN